MPESNPSRVGPGDALDATPGREVDAQTWVAEAAEDGAPAASDAFQTLASDVRLAVLVHLLRAERDGASPTFSDLQSAVGSDSSARFAYHLRQLDGHFVRKAGDGYELTRAGRRAAEAVLAGTFTSNDSRRAS
ncbi:DUF7347 domain-containing protein [Halobacterium litoreum]|uniref:DUF7347 domain-containing protein n=1 Tax=Halobacterium litoreum TaxID=2039234 RepID=A0ABD5NFJ7_9EURY|nr:hypothetical protein [Halobacterium litoreum]UHH13027.1 hypothetical protein LT972_12795 [Halobacterium litoreum]